MDQLINESDRGQPVFGVPTVATPVLGVYKLDPDPAKWSPEECHEHAAVVELAGPAPTNPAHLALRERENRARVEERLASALPSAGGPRARIRYLRELG